MLLHASLTGINFLYDVRIFSNEQRECMLSFKRSRAPKTVHILSPLLWLSPTPTQWMLMSLFPGVKRPGHEAYHFPPFNNGTKNVSLFHMHLARDQERLYTLPYLMLYVRVFIGHVGREIDILCEAGCTIGYPRLNVRTSSHALDLT